MSILSSSRDKKNQSSLNSSKISVDLHVIEGTIDRIMASHMKSTESKLLDIVKKTVSSEVENAMSGVKVKDAMKKAAKSSADIMSREVVGSMQAPMVTALHQVCIC